MPSLPVPLFLSFSLATSTTYDLVTLHIFSFHTSFHFQRSLTQIPSFIFSFEKHIRLVYSFPSSATYTKYPVAFYHMLFHHIITFTTISFSFSSKHRAPLGRLALYSGPISSSVSAISTSPHSFSYLAKQKQTNKANSFHHVPSKSRFSSPLEIFAAYTDGSRVSLYHTLSHPTITARYHLYSIQPTWDATGSTCHIFSSHIIISINNSHFRAFLFLFATKKKNRQNRQITLLPLCSF